MNKLGYIEVSTHPLSGKLRKHNDDILAEFVNNFGFHLSTKPNNIMGRQIDQRESNNKQLYKGKIQSKFTRIVAESCSLIECEAVWGLTEESKQRGDAVLAAAQQSTPVLENILKPYHPYVGCVGFNLMHPGSKLSMHYGMISKYIRFHLGLVCDPEAKFMIENYADRAWEKGKVWAFDDGDAYHGTIHNGSTPRLILIVDIDRAAFTNITEEVTWY